MKVFIPKDIAFDVSPRTVFLLARPFKLEQSWGNDEEIIGRWGLDGNEFNYTDDISRASILILPYAINLYLASGNLDRLAAYDRLCADHGIRAYGFVTGDWGRMFPDFEHITYFRLGGFRSQLNHRNLGFPFSLSDHFGRLYGEKQIKPRGKRDKPIIGFCGHASLSHFKRLKENLKVIRENVTRALHNPTREDWEPIFPSAYRRATLLMKLERSDRVKTNFVYREHYRAGARTDHEREVTTKEYYDNILESDYVLCMRGGGNFSVRLYETLMMGRIPVFINTDCLLPFPDHIAWKEHVVWVEWKDRDLIEDSILNFHDTLNDDQFVELQLRNRRLWEETLSVKGIYRFLAGQASQP